MECTDNNKDIIFRNNILVSHPGYVTNNTTEDISSGFDLTHNINNDPVNMTLMGSFTNQSVNPYPALLVTEDKLKQQNNHIHQNIMDHEVLTINNEPSCKEVFNVRNLNDSGLLQEGYARNIDLDSELKRINYLTDKCYYDNYKYHPHEAEKGNGLYCHRDILVNDYSYVGLQKCKPRGQYKSAIQPGHLQHKEEIHNNMSDNTVSYGTQTRSQYPNQKYDAQCAMVMEKPNPCINSFNSFNQVNTLSSVPDSAKPLLHYKQKQSGNLPNYYKFNGDIYNHNQKYKQEYPVQRIFNNFTKRSTLPNFHNTFDINPKYL